MSDKIKAEHFPWLKQRGSKDTLPTYKIIARSMTLGGDSVVMLHKAGSEYVENYYIRDLVTHEDILSRMDENEAKLLRWVVVSEKNDPLK
tara:strand:- start:5135 stop:5404 length:270 start_codon:yes stop_codon:yes gene_type:complete